jgi:hypothetical protein
MKIISVDGGAFIEPPRYKFHNAYFSVLDEESGELIHFEKDIGDFYSGLAEYKAIEWAVKNIFARPITIYSDCVTAIAWANKKGKYKNWNIEPPNLDGVILQYRHGTKADRWNAENHSPKRFPKATR